MTAQEHENKQSKQSEEMLLNDENLNPDYPNTSEEGVIRDENGIHLDGKNTKTASIIYSKASNAEITQKLIELQQKTLNDKSKVIAYLIIALSVSIILFFIMLGIWSAYPKNKVIAMTDSSVICHVTPQDNPNLNEITISQFAQEAVLQTNSFSYADYESKMEWTMSHYFNEKGRRRAVAGIETLGLLKLIKENLFTVKSTVNGVPSIGGIDEKNLTWIVRVPMRVEIYGATATPREIQEVLATVEVTTKSASKVNTTGLSVSNVTYERLR